MEFLKKSNWTMPALITGVFMLLTVIMAALQAPWIIVILFALGACAALVATCVNLEEREATLAPIVWLTFPLLQFISALIMKGAAFGSYTTFMMLTVVFGMFGVTAFVTLLLVFRCWKTRYILIAGAVLAVLACVFVVARALALSIVTVTYTATIALYALVLLDIYISNQFASSAKDKGYEGRQYFWLTFLLPVVGMLLVASLPSKNVNEALLEYLKGNKAESTEAEKEE